MSEIETISRKQMLLLSWWKYKKYKDKKAIIADGSIRTGKTVFMSLGYIAWSMDTFNETNFGIAGKTIASLRRNVVTPLIGRLEGLGYEVRERRTDNMLIISFGNKVNYYYLFGGKDEGSQDLVQGITVAGFYFDEVALMPQSFVNQATGRALTVPNRKYWFNCNPASPFHYFKTEWIDDLQNKEAIRIKFKMNDNPILSIKDIETASNMYTGAFYDRYILGEWSATDGLVYANFNPKTMVYEVPDETLCEDFVVSIDYGMENPTVFCLYGLYKGSWYAMKEYYHDGRHSNVLKEDTDYLNDYIDFVGNLRPKTIIDPSASSFINGLIKRGIRVIKANNDVNNGIRLTQMRLTEGRIKITNACKNGIKELGTYVWDQKAAEKGIDQVVKKYDHFCDQLRYFIMYKLAYKSNNNGIKLFKNY